MALYNFHRVLILAATAFCVVFALYCFQKQDAGGAAFRGMGIGSCIVAALGVAYFVYFNINLRRKRALGQARMSRLEQLQKLHAADPKDPFCTYGIALEHAKTGAFDEALRWLEKTLEADTGYCYAYFQKAKMFIEKGDDAQARQVLTTGIAVARKLGTPDANHAAEEMGTLMESLD